MGRLVCFFFSVGLGLLSWELSLPVAFALGQDLSFSTLSPPSFASVLQSSGLGPFINFSTSCGPSVAPVAAVLGNMANGVNVAECPMALNTSLGTPCPPGGGSMGVMQPIDTASLCSNPAAGKQLEALFKSALCADVCQLTQLTTANAEAQCLQNALNTLQTQIGQYSGLYNAVIQRQHQDVLLLNKNIEDTQSKLKQTNALLGGGDSPGSQGLLDIQAQTNQLLSNMSQQIQTVTTQSQAITRQQQILKEQIQTRTLKIAMNNFNTMKIATYRCAPNGPPVSALEYVKCRFQQNQNLGNNGKIEVNATMQAQAESKVDALDSILNNMMSQTPQSGDLSVPTGDEKADATQNQAAMNNNVTLTNLKDIQDRYASQLSGYRIGNTNAWAFVDAQFQYQYQLANQQVQNELSRSSSQAGTMSYQILQGQQALQVNMSNLMVQYKQQYNADMIVLSRLLGTGNYPPLNTTACDGAVVSVQINCLKNIQTSFQGLLNGTSPSSNKTLVIQGNGSLPSIEMSCKGINGCIATLQTLAKNLNANQQQQTTQRDAYILQANQIVDTYTKTLATQLSVQSQFLQSKMSQLMAAMANQSASPASCLATQAPASEPLQKEADGLYKAPTHVLNLLSSSVSPPLPTAQGLASCLGALATARNNVNSDLAQNQQQLAQVHNLERSCNIADNQSRVDAAINMLNRAEYCQDSDVCKGKQGKNIDDALEVIRKLGQKSGIRQGSIQSLEDGITNLCEDDEMDPAAPAPVFRNMARYCKAALNSVKGLKNLPLIDSSPSGFAGVLPGL